MDDHVALSIQVGINLFSFFIPPSIINNFTFQAIIVYLVVIFGIKIWMRNRQPYKLKMPLAVRFNFVFFIF